MRNMQDMVPPDIVRAAYRERLPDEEASAIDLLFALRACVQRVNADLQRWLGAEAVTPGRMQMLMVLWAKGEPVRQADLGPLLHISRPSVSELTDALERDGLVERRTDPHHKLRFMVCLTDSGQQVAQRLLRENVARLCLTFAGLDAATRHEIARTLDLIRPTVVTEGRTSAPGPGL